jgi:hypothetical protein
MKQARLPFLMILCAILLAGSIRAQDFFGLSAGNYAGTGLIAVNPASLVNTRTYLGFNLLSAGAFAESNYIYLSGPRSPLFEALSAEPDFSSYHPPDYPFWDRYGPRTNDMPKRAYAHTSATGPSFFLSMGRDAVAIRTAHRSWFQLRDFPWHLAKFMYEGVDYSPQQGLEYDVRGAELVLAGAVDLSFSYARVFTSRDRHLFSFGLTYHHLIPNFGAYLEIREMDYMVPNDSLLLVGNLDASYAYSLPMNYLNNDITRDFGLDQGTGLAVDAGFNYYYLKERPKRWSRSLPRPCANTFDEYSLRLGVSVMDLGRLTYNNNALVHSVDGRGTDWPGIDTVEFRNLHYFTQLLGSQFYAVPGGTVRDYIFTIYLPAVISLQADASLGKGLYFQTTFIHPIKLGDPWIRHPVMLYAAPRFESRFIEAGLPVSIYDFSEPHLGFYMRLGWLTFGTDDLGSVFSPGNFDSGGLYAGLRINLLPGNCGGGGTSIRRGSDTMNSLGRMKRRGRVPCEAYW